MGWADSFIGWRLLINSESTIEEDSRASDEHGVLSSCVLAKQGGLREVQAEGRAMTFEEAVTYALEDDAASTT